MSASMSSTTIDTMTMTEPTTTMSTTESMDSSTGDEPARCGNNMVDVLDENCDGSDMPAMNCSQVGLGGGMLGCYPEGHKLECQYDLTECSGASQCGNDQIEGTEQCDNDNLAKQTCETVSEDFIGGELSCVAAGPDNECTFNTSACDPCLQMGDECETNAQCCGDLVCSILAGDRCGLL